MDMAGCWIDDTMLGDGNAWKVGIRPSDPVTGGMRAEVVVGQRAVYVFCIFEENNPVDGLLSLGGGS